MIPNGETSFKKFDVVNDCNRVEYVRGSSSDDEAASFATHLLFKAQTQMREALCEEKRGGQLDDKRVNRIIKSNLKRIAENFYLQFGSLRTKMVAKTVDEVIRMQHQESPESRADLCPDDLWSDVVLLPSMDTQTEAARGWRSLSEVPFRVCKNLQIDWTKLPEVASKTAAVFLAEAAVSGSVDAATIRSVLYLCGANYIQFAERPREEWVPWTAECERALVKQENELQQRGCGRFVGVGKWCEIDVQICGDMFLKSISRDFLEFIPWKPSTLPGAGPDSRTAYHVIRKSGGLYVGAVAKGPSWCYNETAIHDEL
ncbi:hypothetical protein GNI_057870 [Gregarina niphandrodes]|uniref:Uncharacterized protein n=1 Tax=Gregarina niphandrodes TaxID=110365 RepID=A0A023B8L8_GRENI|nr:hypothetical protein GNI_057870 [Gregarina niphandrodes]EZG69504.1 hypothetical protein GNI_057870 [Gregarina niphandrodes]|eukprot:XP_011130009.1 hypothetical protein GNI_057870 [Gregarina niphandrodes]